MYVLQPWECWAGNVGRTISMGGVSAGGVVRRMVYPCTHSWSHKPGTRMWSKWDREHKQYIGAAVIVSVRTVR